jgi:hypothetical protein
VEQVQIALTTSPEAEIALHLKFAERRLDEMERLDQDGGNVGGKLRTAVSNLESHSAAVKDAVVAMSDGGRPPSALTVAIERHRDGITEMAGKAGCDRSRAGAGCEGLETALASSNLALKQLRDESPPETLARAPEKPAQPADKPRTDRSPSKSPETAAASPATTPSESAAPSGSPDPSTSPSEEPSLSPSPDPSASPSSDPAQEPTAEPTPVASSEAPGQPAEPGQPDVPPLGTAPNDTGAIEPHATGEGPTSPLP